MIAFPEKRRGRPKNSQTSDPKQEAFDELQHAMGQYEYVYEIPENRLEAMEYRMRTRAQDAFAEDILDFPMFEENTQELKRLAKKYFAFFYIDELPYNIAVEACKANGVPVEMAELSLIDLESEDTEEVREIVENLAYKQRSRREYLEKKPALNEFVDGSLELLPEEKQQILIEHKDEIFAPDITYQAQVELVIRLIFDPNRGSASGPSAIGRLFGVSRGTISTHYKRMNSARKPVVGRPGALDEESFTQVIVYIRDCYEKKKSPNIFNLIDYIFCEFHININEKTLRGIIDRSANLKSVRGIPLDNARAEVPVSVVTDHYENLDRVLLVEQVPPEFFYNVDESGFQEFNDALHQHVFVPAETEDEVYYCADRSTKRATLIGCICMDGTALKPLIVSPNKTVSRQLYINGYNESNCLIVSQEHGFINSEIFAFWADHIFFPEVQKKRQQLGYDGIVILTLDGCSPHKSLYFEDECTKQNVYPFFEPPGTSDQVQALDLGIFGCQKRKHRRRKMLGLTKTDCVIVEIVDSWMKSTTPGSVVSAFNQAGIYIDSSDEKTIVRASANKARAVRGVEYTNGDNVVSGRKTYTIPSF